MNKYFVKNCLDCGGNTNVIDSRANAFGAIYRRRKCTKCGLAFNTVEVEEAMFDNLDLLEEIKDLRGQIRELKDRLAKVKSIAESISEV